MKNVFYFFCLLYGVVGNFHSLQAQIVTIPDANFKAKLIALGIDTNSDGNIQIIEAQAVDSLDISVSNISDITGISDFVNLQLLNCNNNQLASLNISNNTALTELNCNYNQLTSLDVSNNTILSHLDCKANQLTSLNVFNNTSLSYLSCSYNSLTSLDISNNITLNELSCSSNQLTSLAVSNNTVLTNLNCSYNHLTSLDVSNNIALTDLSFYYNQLTSLNIFNNTNLTHLVCHNNQLTTLNVSNNTALTDLNCWNNQLVSLNFSNNIALTNLICYTNNLTSLDVSNNTTLELLYCYDNQLTSLDVSNNIALTDLECNGNQLASLDVSNNVALINLGCGGTSLTSLDVSNNTLLEVLNCSVNLLSSLDISNNMALSSLFCGSNSLTSLDVSNNNALTYLDCKHNQLTSLDVSNNTNLVRLYCNNNLLTSLDVSNNIVLINSHCEFNQLTSLDISNNPVLYYFNCSNNQLTNLDVSSCTLLEIFICNNNQLSSLDFSNNVALTNLLCQVNQLTSLDVTNNINLSSLSCQDNDLHYIIAKNGKSQLLNFDNNPNLTYICSDANQLANIQNNILQYGMTNVFIGTLCTYAPGGISYNTLSGKSFIDLDMNGCAPNDSTFPFTFISVNNGTNTYYTCSTQAGDYLAYLSAGNFTLIPQIVNNSYFSGDTATVSFPNNNNNIQTQDLCITPNGVFPDVEISLIPLIPARPGFDANYQIQYKNIGTTTANGDITLDFQGNKMNFVSASISPTNQTTSQLTWNYNNLQPFEMRTISVSMNILPPPTNNINDVIPFHANISLANDTDASNNTALLNQTVVGAYDPNDKTCLEGKLLHNDKIGDYLHYLIRFQNTGNYPAENVVVIDTLDAAKYDLASLQILETSHNAHIDLKNNVLQFYFENIQLADSFSNEPESHGFVVYKIKTKSTLPLNSIVKNKAEIYFDYNLPIITNLETTTFSSFMGVEYPAQKPHFQCYPNPAQNTLTIETPNKADFLLFNVMGEMLSEMTVHNKENIDISFLPKGMYLLRAKNGGTGISFVKE